MQVRDDPRRKPVHNQVVTIKQNPSVNSLLDIKQRKRSEKSKQKENDRAKPMPFRQRQVIKKTVIQRTIQQPSHHPQYTNEEYDNKKPTTNYNFKNLKSNMNKKITTAPNNKEYYFQHPQQTSHTSSSGGISINVNIQNMVSNKKAVNPNLSEIHSQRSSSINKADRSVDKKDRKQKGIPLIDQNKLIKKKKVSTHVPSVVQDFECEQQLQIPSRTQGSKTVINQNINHVINNQAHSKSAISISNRNQGTNAQNIHQNNSQFNNRENSTNPNIVRENRQIKKRDDKQKVLIEKKPLIIQHPAVINVINHKQEIRRFQESDMAIRQQSEGLFLMQMVQRQEEQYRVRSTYLEQKQNNFKPNNRAILIDWMMQVCSEYCVKRDTFHIATVLTDKYFSTVQAIPKSDWQLVGASAMYIAAKLQEFQPKSSADFSIATSNKYSSQQIVDMELKICKALKFNLNPPTFYMWANRMMENYDTYLDHSEVGKHHPLFKIRPKLYFKKYDDQSYQNFLSLMQYIDCAILDIETVQYPPQLLVLSFMYIYIGWKFEFFTQDQIVKSFPQSSLYLADDTDFNDFFRCFLSDSFALDIDQLLPQIQFAAHFIKLRADPTRPDIEEQQIKNYEDFISFQTYNKNSIIVAHNKRRNPF